MKKILIAIPLLLVASCATIVNGKSSEVVVTSVPPGLSFTTNSGLQGTTPATVSLPNGDEVIFSWVTPEGVEGTTVSKTRMSAWVIGNVVFGGLIGIVIDLVADGAHIHEGDLFIGPLTPEMAVQEEQLAARQASRPEIE